MTWRAARALSLLFLSFLAVAAPAAAAGPARSIVTTDNADYFGFDLRAEQNMSLEDCRATCLADGGCRAFTYNTKARSCFLKSDYNQLKPFPGAVAGKVVPVDGDPDIGAPAELTFLPAAAAEELNRLRAAVTSATPSESGLAALVEAGDQALRTRDGRSARDSYRAALAISRDDQNLWIGLAQAALAIEPSSDAERAAFAEEAAAAALQAYRLTRTAPSRAEALAVLAAALDRRDLYRPALSAYEASLALVSAPAVAADFRDLKARKGFRVVEHTVDADSAAPRICAQFSEPLVKSGLDYAPFVTVDGQAPKAVEAKDKEICVEGLAHGARYRIAFRTGLPAAIGEVLETPVELDVYVRDRAPSVRFTGDSFVLPATARRGIPLVSVNMDEAAVRLYRVGDRSLAQLLSGYQFLRQLDSYEIGNVADQLGEPVWEGRLAIAGTLNQEVTTSFPVDEALPERKPGVYLLTAAPVDDRREEWETRATQWFVVSDVGLSTYAGEDGLSVFARALSSARPLPGVALSLVARNNEVLGTATTDANGRATFTAGLTRGNGGLAPAAIMARGAGDDFVFLDMTRAGFDLTDRGVEGRAAPGALDVFAYTERGIYRAGETVHVAALARDQAARAVERLPLTFVFTRPDGVEDRRIVGDGAALGGHGVELPLEANAMRGTWQVAIHTDPKQPAVAEAKFLVEDFVPDRIEFDLASDRQEIARSEAADITVDGRFLYGAPAAGLALEGEVSLATMTEWERFPGYRFGLADEEEGEATRQPLEDLPPVGADGKATFPVRLDKLPSTTRMLNAEVAVRMREGAGRAVERTLDIEVRPEGLLIGVKPEFAGDEVPQGGRAAFKVIAVDPDGNRQALAGLAWSLVKVERNYQWYRSGNAWAYEPVTSTSTVASGRVDADPAREADIAVPVDWGRYRLEVSTDDPAGPATSVEFDAGWFVEATSTETPDGLEIALDKESYAAGETARLKVSPRFAGELLIAVGSETLRAVHTASIPAEGATIDIPVGADWGAGAYVTATLFRPGDAGETRMPARAIGVKWLKVDPGAKKLDVSLSPPGKMEPRQALSIPVAVAGLPAGTEAYAMVAAVDVGILNLTSYAAPDPEAWFFGQRQLGLELRDLYGRLIDGSLGAMGRLRTGGDGGGMAAEGSPPTEKLVAFFAGPVRLDGDGKATIDFDIPQFNGTVRVMAVAWTREAVGHAEADVIVRDPVVVTAGLPRFMAPGDRATLHLDIANTDGPAGEYALSVEGSGGVEIGSGLPAAVTLAPGQRTAVSVPLLAGEAGDADVRVSLVHSAGLAVAQDLSLPIRPAAMPVTTRTVVSLAPGGGSLKVDGGLLAASLLDGATVSVGVSPSAALDVPSLLLALDRYPYGCAEQTTSRALPLLYVAELAKSAGMADDPALRERIQQAIDTVLNYQSSSGSFGLWSPGSGDLWLDAYVSDFLTRAREQGFDVPDAAMRQALDNLQNGLAYDIDVEDRGSEIAYALYVLARNKKASVGDLRYYADTKLEAFRSPMAVAQLAAALALYGDAQRAQATFGVALTLANASSGYDYSRSDYGSALRDGAAMLALAAETRPLPQAVPAMVGYVTEARRRQPWTSTQDEAWMLLAARAIGQGDSGLELAVDGTPHAGNFATRVSGEELQARPITIVNRGQSTVDAVVTAVAAPAQPLPAGGDGFTIERTYYAMDGSEANVTEARQNDRYVVVIRIEELNEWPSRIVVSDLLPAGFEIDNPGLVSSAELSNFSWLEKTEAAHLEFRDDRFVAAFDHSQGDARQATMAYVVRAVTPGVYAHPAATVEDMYRPQFSARTATGMMEVKPAL